MSYELANQQISNLRGFKSTSIDVNITFERTHQIFTTFCILRSFMKLMSETLDIFMFVSDIYSVVFINLNRIVTLDSNQGGAVLYSLESRNEFAYQREQKLILTSKPIQVTVFAFSTVVFINLTRHNSSITWDFNISQNFLLAKNLQSLFTRFQLSQELKQCPVIGHILTFSKKTYQFSTEFTEINETKRLKTVAKKIFSFLQSRQMSFDVMQASIHFAKYRSSRPRVFYRVAVLKSCR